MEWGDADGRLRVSWPRHAYQNGNWTVVNANGQPYADILQKNRSGLDGSKWRTDRRLLVVAKRARTVDKCLFRRPFSVQKRVLGAIYAVFLQLSRREAVIAPRKQQRAVRRQLAPFA